MTSVSLGTNQNVLNKMDIGGRVIIEITCPNGQSTQANSQLIGFKKKDITFSLNTHLHLLLSLTKST